uniref:G_PROTEIN_RECEP_F1_2 domain-containing protein n=1 Tax=Meloidogyne hapla TaxID=6305 RepID=A0A1I8BC23_MELHA
MLLPILSFDAANIDSFVAVPALLMYVAASGSNMPVLFAFSKEYNRAFKNTFKHLFFGKPLQQTIFTTSSNANARIGIIRDMNNNRAHTNPIAEPIRQFV